MDERRRNETIRIPQGSRRMYTDMRQEAAERQYQGRRQELPGQQRDLENRQTPGRRRDPESRQAPGRQQEPGRRQTSERRRDSDGRQMPDREREIQRRKRAEAVRIQRERKRKRLMRVKILCNVAVISVFVCILIQFGGKLSEVWMQDSAKPPAGMSGTSEGEGQGPEDLSQNGEEPVFEAAASGKVLDQKQLLTDGEVESMLRELALQDTMMAAIYTDRTSYPEELLAGLVYNHELKEFVYGYLTTEAVVTGGFEQEEMEEDFPLFLQWDARWGYAPYGESNIGISGCGPTCLSMVIYALSRDESATPDALADLSMKNGHYVSGVGTAWTLMTDAAKSYGIKGYELGMDEEVMKQQLDWGNPIICAMRPGDFTKTGHFIVIYGYDEDGFMVNDPNSRERSEKRWPFDTLRYQIRNLWAFSKN